MAEWRINPLLPVAPPSYPASPRDAMPQTPVAPDQAWEFNRDLADKHLALALEAARNPQTWVDGARLYGNALIAGTGAPKTIKAFHGATASFDVFDPSRTGTGAMADYFAKGTARAMPPAMYLTSEQAHAASYGEPLAFDITGKVKNFNAVPVLKSWARELGYQDTQRMVDEHFDGDPYRALNADQYFLDRQRDAKAAGVNAISVDFGDIINKAAGPPHKIGKVYVVSDPSMLKRSTP